MKAIEKQFVSLNIERQKYEVGELIISEQKIYFRYNSDFKSTGLNLSPIKLPFNTEINTCPKEPFDGLFGVFNDSLPDGWGRLLLDRTLSSKGTNISRITPLDRLAFVGNGGMGALVYQPEFESGSELLSEIELDSIANEVSQILQGTSSEIIEELFILGGSSGGARPLSHLPELQRELKRQGFDAQIPERLFVPDHNFKLSKAVLNRWNRNLGNLKFIRDNKSSTTYDNYQKVINSNRIKDLEEALQKSQ